MTVTLHFEPSLLGEAEIGLAKTDADALGLTHQGLKGFSMPSGPMRFRYRTSEVGSQGGLCWKNSKPQKCCEYGFSTQSSSKRSSLTSKLCLR